MTCKSIYAFLEENGIAPTPENKKRWQAGWTISELKQGYESILDNYRQSIENEFGEGFIRKKAIQKARENEARIRKAIEKEKKRRENVQEKFEQCTNMKVGIHLN